ncbi:hypothetical protein [Flavobacterium rhizosphaerae]|uniref:DUF4595 domain-containing protein n=1 Tax=Flavobacterium rhizosphaerae TaxID=3163298 RepID=A0ABW8YVP5_9FLAO
MKNKFFSALAAFSLLALASCSDDDSSSTIDGSAKMYIKTVSVVSSDDNFEGSTLTVNYDGEGKVTSATDGDETSYFAYQNGNLQNISGASDVLAVADFTNSAQDAYEVGEVLDYDNNGNPVKLRLFERDYDGSIYEEYVGELTYEDKPNLFYYTLEAAGIIDVLNDVELNFSATPQSQELVKAKMLLPVNNPKKLVIKYTNGEVKGQVVADYVYNSDNYPTSATFTSSGEGDTEITTIVYTYK